jgi:CubicO group peptidase (beta-lactamase class C family)
VVEEGLIGLDEPVDRLLPELAERRVLRRLDGPLSDTVSATRAITTRDLLTFTFGFGQASDMYVSPTPGDPLHAGRSWPVVAAADELGLSTFGVQDPDVQPDPDTWIANLGTLPLLARPGERWL